MITRGIFFYDQFSQAQKFVGVDDPLAIDFVEQIKVAKSPEEAARIGRSVQRKYPNLVSDLSRKLPFLQFS